MANLEDALKKIARENGLTSISVTAYADFRAANMGATVHWSGYAKSGNACAFGRGPTAHEAIAAALAAAAADRVPAATDIGVLPTLAEAA